MGSINFNLHLQAIRLVCHVATLADISIHIHRGRTPVTVAQIVRILLAVGQVAGGISRWVAAIDYIKNVPGQCRQNGLCVHLFDCIGLRCLVVALHQHPRAIRRWVRPVINPVCLASSTNERQDVVRACVLRVFVLQAVRSVKDDGTQVQVLQFNQCARSIGVGFDEFFRSNLRYTWWMDLQCLMVLMCVIRAPTRENQDTTDIRCIPSAPLAFGQVFLGPILQSGCCYTHELMCRGTIFAGSDEVGLCLFEDRLGNPELCNPCFRTTDRPYVIPIFFMLSLVEVVKATIFVVVVVYNVLDSDAVDLHGLGGAVERACLEHGVKIVGSMAIDPRHLPVLHENLFC
mmetsp:Transcript_8702/g.15674  ORF Transcript_8702/g.15674 Transcript_8702/m.15674 type:complete len:345 (-) Transcript_8702:249-1283(-)